MFKHTRTSFYVAPLLGTSLVVLALSGCHRDPNVRKQKYLESGVRYEKEGKYKEAVIQFSNALKVDNNFGPAHYELAETYAKLGAAQNYFSELRKTIQIDPKNIKAHLELGALLVSRYPDAATEQANAVLAIDPNNADAYALMAAVATNKGDHEGALKDIHQAISIDPNRAAFHTQLGLTEDPTGGAVAEQELEKAVSLDAGNANAHLTLAAVLQNKGDLPGAEQQMLLGIKEAPDNMRARLALAGLYLRMHDEPKAVATLHQVTEDFGDKPQGADILAEYLIRHGQIDQAETTYADLVSKHPKSVQLKLAYIRILRMKHEDAKAKPLLDDLSKSNGTDPQVEVLNASTLVAQGKLNEASDLLQKAVKDDAQNLRLRLALASVSMQRGDVNTAETNFREAVRLDPNSAEAQAGVAEIAGRKHDYSTLAETANNALKANPNFAPAYLWRAVAELGENQTEKAESDLQTAIAKNPNFSQAYLELGQLRFSQKKFPEGTAALQKALELNPNSEPALHLLASRDVVSNQPEKALEMIRQQIAKEPNNASFWYELAELQLLMKDFAGARDSAGKTIQLNPSDVRGVNAYAQAQMAAGDKAGALATWQHWSNAHPNDANATSTLALIEETMGDTQKAMDFYRKSLAIDPNQAMAQNNLAFLLVDNGGDIDAALTLAQNARRQSPNSPNSADTLAWVYFYKGRYASARDLLELALKDSPNDPTIEYHLGMAYSKLGDKTSAALHLKKAASLAPPTTKIGKEAQTALGQLG